jgi:hypothetical protein
MPSQHFVHSIGILLTAIASCFAAANPISAQAPAPPPPARYWVQLRYRINAPLNQRISQFLELTRFLDSQGFRKEPGAITEAEDPTETEMVGTVPSESASRLLDDPRVKALLLNPAGYSLPEDPTTQVKVQLELVSGLPVDRQRVLADQVRQQLAHLGFQEKIGYDHREHSRLLGTLPRGELEVLLDDLRELPGGWLTPRNPLDQLPSPLRVASPVRITEVIPEPPSLAPAKDVHAAPAALSDIQQKISSDLRALEANVNPVRLEVILSYQPTATDADWRAVLERAAPLIRIEGRLGEIVTALCTPKQAEAIASLPIVSVVRLPRPALLAVQTMTGRVFNTSEVLESTGIKELQSRGIGGKGVRVALIDGDFRGYERFVGNRLPALTRYVDLTAERNSSLEPDPFSSQADAIGHGTQCALALTIAAPRADLTLIRIDPSAPHQLLSVIRLLRGEAFLSDSAYSRNDELAAETIRLRQARQALRVRQQEFMEYFGHAADPEKRRAELRKPAEELEKDLAQKRQELDNQDRELTLKELLHRRLQERFVTMIEDQKSLAAIRIVACGLVWNEGYPIGGRASLAAFLDDRAFPRTLWFQAAGDTRGQVWSGLFQDADGNGVMEFADPGTGLRKGRWTRELNFLAWERAGAGVEYDLPAKTKIRISWQWREVHDPSFARAGEDVYKKPLASLRVLVLRQRDPTGSTVAADELEVVARSQGLPQRIDNQPAWATYEESLEFTVDSPGRFAIRIEGAAPTGTRPEGTPRMSAIEPSWELRPRFFVSSVDGLGSQVGRPVFQDYWTSIGSLGTPPDAASVITVGAAGLSGSPDPASAGGPPMGRLLLTKPDFLQYDALDLDLRGTHQVAGSSLAAAYAAGMTASCFEAGIYPFASGFTSQPGLAILRVPK